MCYRMMPGWRGRMALPRFCKHDVADCPAFCRARYPRGADPIRNESYDSFRIGRRVADGTTMTSPLSSLAAVRLYGTGYHVAARRSGRPTSSGYLSCGHTHRESTGGAAADRTTASRHQHRAACGRKLHDHPSPRWQRWVGTPGCGWCGISEAQLGAAHVRRRLPPLPT